MGLMKAFALVLVLSVFSAAGAETEPASTESSTSTTEAGAAACATALKEYSEANGNVTAICQDEVIANLISESMPCQAVLSSCRAFLIEDVRASCLDEDPSQETCEKLMNPTSPAASCQIVERMSDQDLATRQRDLNQQIQDLIQQRSDLDKESEDFASNLAKALQDVTTREAEIRKQIADLRSTLEELGPKSQAELQTMYGKYIKALDDLQQQLENEYAKYQTAQLAKNEQVVAARQKCQETATNLFQQDVQARAGLTQARRNSTSLNDLTGHARRFRANFNNYLEACHDSDLFQAQIRAAENMLKMAKDRYDNASRRVETMRNHLQAQYQRNQQSLQASVQNQMRSLMQQMANLEQEITRARAQAVQSVALGEEPRRERAQTMELITSQLAELNSEKTTYTCVQRCQPHLKSTGGIADMETLQNLIRAHRQKEMSCSAAQLICSNANQRGPASCDYSFTGSNPGFAQ